MASAKKKIRKLKKELTYCKKRLIKLGLKIEQYKEVQKVDADQIEEHIELESIYSNTLRALVHVVERNHHNHDVLYPSRLCVHDDCKIFYNAIEELNYWNLTHSYV